MPTASTGRTFAKKSIDLMLATFGLPAHDVADGAAIIRYIDTHLHQSTLDPPQARWASAAASATASFMPSCVPLEPNRKTQEPDGKQRWPGQQRI